MMNTSDLAERINERRNAWRWFGIIVFIFALNLSFLVIAIALGYGDRSLSILPNYKKHAVNADAWQARRAATHQRGWVVEPQIGSIAQTVQFSIIDRDAAPVTGMRLSLKAFHHTDPGKIFAVPLSESSPGVYHSDWAPHRAGNWQVTIESSDPSSVDMLMERTWFVEPTSLQTIASQEP